MSENVLRIPSETEQKSPLEFLEFFKREIPEISTAIYNFQIKQYSLLDLNMIWFPLSTKLINVTYSLDKDIYYDAHHDVGYEKKYSAFNTQFWWVGRVHGPTSCSDPVGIVDWRLIKVIPICHLWDMWVI